MPREVIARSAAIAGLLRVNGSPHLGLIFDRFPRLLNRANLLIEEAARRDWLEEFCKLANGPTQTSKRRLQAVHARLDAIMAAGHGQRRVFTTTERLATGLGNPNAADIGFSFDFACGLPGLAGSAVKGLVREGAEIAAAGGQRIADLLGEGPTSASEGQGGILIFLDALPQEWPRFEIDIITRHHAPDALATQRTPLETDQPNPIPFLTVAAGTSFVFRILGGTHATSETYETVWTWLARALDFGAGAKTAVGYGRMQPGEHVQQTTGAQS